MEVAMISICVGATQGLVIKNLIRSILEQTYEDWELILVAQGNDPALLGTCKKAEQCDQRIRVIQMVQMSKSAALNKGFGVARGEIIAFTDEDCEAAPDWLEVIAECFEREPRVGLVAGDLLSP